MWRDYEVERIDKWLIVLKPDDLPESPDDWGDEECFLTESDGRNWSVGRKGWSQSKVEGHMPWGEGPWETAYGCEFPPEVYPGPTTIDGKTINSTMWSAARSVFEDWMRATYLDYDEEPEWEFHPVRVRDFGSNSADVIECSYDRANAYVAIRMEQGNMGRMVCSLQRQSAQEMVDSLLNTWNHYLSGDIWVYRVYEIKPEYLFKDTSDLLLEEDTTDTEECCGGYYGHSHALESAREAVSYLTRQDVIKVTNKEVEIENRQ